jgi:hypothetical protein
MEWAKLRSGARFNLAASGMPNLPLSRLGVAIDDLEITGPGGYGYQPLQEALAAKCGVDPENVVAATGTSMANHLALAALIEPGDEVMIEQPAYELLITTAEYLGAKILRFPRPFDAGFQLDPHARNRNHQSSQSQQRAHSGFCSTAGGRNRGESSRGGSSG